ncbi:MAG: glycerol-3-phosphate cytidylyltransferase [Clostridiales Family XIII bacterium]|nr:glycerol-3-phosphate cytidylyltransferase [Clostridiales Family XIII bacterium]
MKRILTYGTYDLLHYGHIRMLKRARALGDYLVVAVSTDEFNAGKGKKAYHDFATRKEMLESIRYVDLVIPEEDWEQKVDDVRLYRIDTVVMGADWEGSDRFEYLREHCELVYLPRTEGVSTTSIKESLGLRDTDEGSYGLPEPNMAGLGGVR